jgi:hypothetical protein
MFEWSERGEIERGERDEGDGRSEQRSKRGMVKDISQEICAFTHQPLYSRGSPAQLERQNERQLFFGFGLVFWPYAVMLSNAVIKNIAQHSKLRLSSEKGPYEYVGARRTSPPPPNNNSRQHLFILYSH